MELPTRVVVFDAEINKTTSESMVQLNVQPLSMCSNILSQIHFHMMEMPHLNQTAAYRRTLQQWITHWVDTQGKGPL